MVQLRPQQSFTVVRQIANHLDTDTNYVQAVIRNAYTDAIIDTIQLTDKGSQRFSKNWQVPADPSGMGFYISIVTSVYTDSGYTTKNSNYGDEENTHLVMEMPRQFGGGGIDAYTVRRILKEELELVKPEPVKPIEFPEQKEYEMRWDDVLDEIKKIQTQLSKVPTNETDLSSVISGLNKAIKAIEDKEVTPKTEIEPLTNEVSKLGNFVDEKFNKIIALIMSSQKHISDDVVGELEKIVKGIEFSIAPSTAQMSVQKKEDKDESVPIDINQFAL